MNLGTEHQLRTDDPAETTDPAGRIASDAHINRAVDVLRRGGVVAIPTDTVYGLAASLDHPLAVERLFSIKGRSGTKAIPVLISDIGAFERLTTELPPAARRLAEAYWPGALTIVVSASDAVPESVRRDGSTVGIRMPDNADALAIIAAAGGALAVTSANRSGGAEARSADEVRIKLGNRVDFIVDGGPTRDTSPSTVVDATGAQIRALRHGAVESWRLMATLQDI
ncbi:MAG TPA: L-threonylcarbamoyladenylate synthase, partial [Thermomicrobiales bacterium]|nr:L-threonylcarbamoyladenylate synthase [Thermomicrobiales bacterium]